MLAKLAFFLLFSPLILLIAPPALLYLLLTEAWEVAEFFLDT